MKQRIRSIKPEAFIDAKLWDVEAVHPHAFRIFAGLWTIADREGRFEWKPREIAALLMPYRQEAVAPTLDALVCAGLVRRYEVRGDQYATLPGFLKHQVPNAREPQSSLPLPPWLSPDAPDDDGRTCVHVQTRAGDSRVSESDARVNADDAPEHIQKCSSGKGREGKGEEGRVDASGQERSLDAFHSSRIRDLKRGEVVGDGVTLGEFIRQGVVAGYETLKQPAPRETRDPLWSGWAELEHWTVEKSRLVGRPQRDTARHLIRCFLRSPLARKKGHPIKFLVENGNEYWADELPAEVA